MRWNETSGGCLPGGTVFPNPSWHFIPERIESGACWDALASRRACDMGALIGNHITFQLHRPGRREGDRPDGTGTGNGPGYGP